jgi:hypothetical protein
MHFLCKARKIIRQLLAIIDERLYGLSTVAVPRPTRSPGPALPRNALVQNSAQALGLPALLICQPACLASQRIDLPRRILLLQSTECFRGLPELVRGMARRGDVVLINRPTHVVFSLTDPVKRLLRALARRPPRRPRVGLTPRLPTPTRHLLQLPLQLIRLPPQHFLLPPLFSGLLAIITTLGG